MPLPDALAAAEKFRAQLLAKERAAAVRLVNAYGDVYRKLQPQIDALTMELDIMAAKGEAKLWKINKLSQLKNLQKQIEVEVARYGVIVENEINMGAREAILAGQTDAKALTQAALPGFKPLDARIMATWNALNPTAVESLLGFLSEGSAMRESLRNQLGPAVADTVGKKLVEGIALGYSPVKTAGIIRRELGQGLTWSLRTARTATLYAYRESSRAAYVANPEIVPGWTWRSARSANTCMACIAQDGTKHPNTEQLNDHHNGKCAMIPDVISYKDLGFDVEEAKPVLDYATGEQWFKAQPEAMQRSMLGPGKYDLYSTGKVKLSDIVGEHDDTVYGKMVIEKPLKDLLSI